MLCYSREYQQKNTSYLLSMRFAYEFAKEADFEKVIKLDKLLHVSKSPQELRIASEKIGMNFIEAIKPLQMEYGEGIFSKYISELEENINPFGPSGWRNIPQQLGAFLHEGGGCGRLPRDGGGNRSTEASGGGVCLLSADRSQRQPRAQGVEPPGRSRISFSVSQTLKGVEWSRRWPCTECPRRGHETWA